MDIPNDVKLIIAQEAHNMWLSQFITNSSRGKPSLDNSLSDEFLYGRMREGHISYAVLERSITLQRAFRDGSDSSFKECYEFVSELW